jgi:hypothetical protein
LAQIITGFGVGGWTEIVFFMGGLVSNLLEHAEDLLAFLVCVRGTEIGHFWGLYNDYYFLLFILFLLYFNLFNQIEHGYYWNLCKRKDSNLSFEKFRKLSKLTDNQYMANQSTLL